MNRELSDQSKRTLAEQIVAAYQAVLDAEQHRNTLLRQAREHGASVREIAELLPVNFNTVFRWSGGRLNGRVSALDQPLAVDETQAREES